MDSQTIERNNTEYREVESKNHMKNKRRKVKTNTHTHTK